MHIFVKTLTGKIIDLKVEHSDGIASIKQQIEDIENIPKDEQYLVHEASYLKDNLTLEDYNVKDEDILDMFRLSEGKMKIYIRRFDSKIIPLDVKITDTIGSVKQQIQDKENIPTDEQFLTFQSLYLRDDLTLEDYSIPNESTFEVIGLDKDMNFYVKSSGKRFSSLSVKFIDKVESDKQEMQNKESISIDE